LKRNEELEDMLTELDPPYETMDELKVGRMLDQYGIPFFYKQPTIIYNEGKNEIWKPSFTMFSYGGALIDYVPGNEDDQIPIRDRLYRYNQIPAVVVGPKDLDNAHWEASLYERLEQAYQQAFDPGKYGLQPVER